MSMQQNPFARIDGWRGPFYPPAVDAVARMLSFVPKETSGGQELLSVALAAVPGFSSAEAVESTDGYSWMRGVVFGAGDRQVLVALPWAFSGTAADRSPAVYQRGVSSIEDAAAAASRVARGLRRQFAVRLLNWYGPYLSPMTLTLYRVWRRYSGIMPIGEAMRGMPGFAGTQDVCTADGYKWHGGVVLKTRSGSALVALPRRRDVRLPLVYASVGDGAEVSAAMLARVARKLLAGQAAANSSGR